MGRSHNAEPRTRTWYRRNLVMDQDLLDRLEGWSGGMDSPVYRLRGEGYSSYVSPSMAQAAIDELEYQRGRTKKRALEKELNDLIGDLQGYTIFSAEQTTKEAGLGDVDAGYDTKSAEDDEFDLRTGNPSRERSRRIVNPFGGG